MSIRVQFGSGENILEGWINHDWETPIEEPLPYGDGTVEMIFAEHVTEHVSHSQALDFLIECYRILEPRGMVRICVPVLERLEPEHGRDIIQGHGHKSAYSTKLIESMLRIAGFPYVYETGRKEMDGHWKIIGLEKDDQETARMEARK